MAAASEHATGWMPFQSIAEFMVASPQDPAVGFPEYDRLQQSSGADSPHQRNVQLVADANTSRMTKAQLKCFYLNAYNVLAIEGAMQRLTQNPQWEGNTGFFRRVGFFVFTRYTVGGQRMSLYHLENSVIRKLFADDPRLHMFLNCCSISCPQMSTVWLTPENVDAVLESVTLSFINKQGGTRLVGDPRRAVSLSKIFEWYAGDFAGGAMSFILPRWAGAPPDAGSMPIIFQEYDWQVNDVKQARRMELLPS